ncbi:hypothetical protein JCM5296_006764 [Sporobolomyces johnsonii]
MPNLDTFLVDLGAPALSTHLAIPPSGAPLKGPAAGLFDRLQHEIDSVNDQTLHLLKDKWDDFEGQLTQGDELLQRLGAEEDELKALESEMDGPDALLPPLIAQLESHQSLSRAHALAAHSVTLLSSLLSFHRTISALSSSITSGHLFPTALEAVKSVTSAVEEGAEEWVEETEVWKALVKWAGEEESRLESALQGAVEGCFDFSTDKAAATSTLTLRTQIAAAPSGPQLSLLDLLQGLEDLASLTGRPERVKALLAGVVKQLLRSFVAPYLEANGAPAKEGDAEDEVKRTMEFGYPASNEEGAHTVILRPASDSTSLPDPIAALETFLTFFTSHSSLFPTPPSRHTSIVSAHLTPPLQSHLISAHLTPSLPASTSSLTPYLALLARATTFEATFLPSLHLFAFLPSSSQHDGHEPDEQRILRTWSASVPSHWARSVSDRALARVRGAVKSWDWGSEGGEEVEVEVREEEEMEGLLRGLELGLEELDEDGKRREKGEQEKERRMELETVPKGAKREMTLEEATAPRPPRRPRTPSPPPPAPLQPAQRPDTPPTPTAPQGSVAKKARKLKLGAAKIVGDVFLPPRSPSPPLLFQGGDAAAPPPSSSPAPASIVHPDPKPIIDDIFEPLEAPSHSLPQQIPAPAVSPERDEEEAEEDEGFAVKVEEKHHDLPREEGVRVLHREIEPEQVEEMLEDVKPVLFVKEESVEVDLPTTEEPAAEVIEREAKPEPVEEELEEIAGQPEEEQQHFVPPPPPPAQQTIVSTPPPSSEPIVSPPIEPEPLLPPRAVPPLVEPEAVLPPSRSPQPSTAPPPSRTVVPPPPRTTVPPPPRMSVPPPPRARSGTGPSEPPPPPRVNAVPPPPPRAGAGFAPPPPRGVLSPPQAPQRPVVSPPPRGRMSPLLPPAPQQRAFSPSGPPPRHIISPPPVSRSPAPMQQPFPAPSVSPKPPQPPAFAPPPPRTVISPPPQSRPTPTLPAYQPLAAPAQPQPQRGGPILNHIQQRFVSPPPSKTTPYSPFPVHATPPPQQSSASGTYIPANDPLLADLFGSSASSGGGQTTRNYFSPDPPGRMQRSNSTSSQTSSIEGAGGYRPSSRGSNSGYAPPPQQQRAYSPMQQYGGYPSHQPQHHQQPQQGSYGGQGPWGLQDDLEELEERFAAGGGGDGRGYGQQYGGEQSAMRLRGGFSLSASEDESDEEEEHEAEEHEVLRLRGGASFDLGEMNDDDGNRSGDDWGFGDGDEAGEGEEDAWGFGDADVEEGTPSPPNEPSPPRPAPTTPSHRPLPSASHAPSASISSTTSFASPSRPRQPSYASPSLAPPPLSSFGAATEEEGAETGEGGDDAWGFDEELEEADETEPVAAPVEPSPAPPEPTLPAAPNGDVGAEVDDWRLGGGVSEEPMSPVAAPLETVHAPASLPVEHEVGDEEVDDWGLGAEEPALPPRVSAPVPTDVEEPAVAAEETVDIVPEEPADLIEYEKAVVESSMPPTEDLLGDESVAEKELEVEVQSEPPVAPTEASVLPISTPVLDDAEAGPTESPFPITTPALKHAVEEPLRSHPFPLTTPALGMAEAGHAEDDGWGLDEEQQEPLEEPAVPLAEPEHEGEVIGEPAVASFNELEQHRAPVLSSPALTARAVEDETPEFAPPAVESAEMSSFLLGTTSTLHAELESSTTVELASEGLEFGLEPVERPAEAAEPIAAGEEETALTAPAEVSRLRHSALVLLLIHCHQKLQQQPFPVEPAPESIEPAAESVEPAAESIPIPKSDAPTPRLPEPLPHHEVFELRPEDETTEARLEDFAARQLDDAALLDVEAGEADDGWGLEADEEEAVESGLVAEEAFEADAKEAEEQKAELPVEEALFEPTPVHPDVAPATSEPPQPLEPLAQDTSSREASEPGEPSPTHSDTVLVDSAAAAMSSPEVIEKSDAWGFDGDEAEEETGAEVLAGESPAPEPSQKPAERESVVEHEAQRPILHDESTVQHEAERPILDLPAATPHPIERTVTPPLEALPHEATSHPIERTVTPPLEALPHEEPIAEDDGWDLDEPQTEGAEALDEESPVEPSHEPVEEPVVEHEAERPTLHDESTVQHEAERPILDLPAATPHPLERTVTPPLEALPHEEPIAEDDGWDLDEQQPEGAEALDEEAPTTEVEPLVQFEELDQYAAVAAVAAVPEAAEPLEQDQPRELTLSSPLAAVEEPAADDPWDLDLEEIADPSVQPPLAALSGGQILEQKEEEGSTVQHLDQRPVTEQEETVEPMAAAQRQPQEHVFSPPPSTLPASAEPETGDAWNFDAGEAASAGAEALQVDDEPPAPHDEAIPPPVEESAVQHLAERTVLDSSSLNEPLPATEAEPQQRTFSPPRSALPAATTADVPPQSDDAWGFDDVEEAGDGADALGTEADPTVAVEAEQPHESSESDVQHALDRPVLTVAEAAAPTVATQVHAQERTFSPPPSSLPLEAPSRSVPSSADPAAISVPLPPSTTAPTAWAETVPAATRHERKESADGWGWDSENAEEEETVAPAAPIDVAAPREAVSGASETAPVVEKSAVEEKPSAPPARKEKMMVSKRSKEIVKIAEEVLVEALTVASPSFEHPSFSAASAPLLQTFVSLLSLYRATAAVHNSTLLASVPAIGMQFANDADWIGREVERVWKTETEGKDLQVLPEQAKEVELAIQSTRQLGKDTRQKQIAIQRAALMESLDEANGFLRTSDDSRYAACERALQQVTHTLQRLALVWKPVMTPTALYTTLGGLVNEVLLRVLDEIEDQTDISEEESIRLNKLCKMLHELESLFEGGEQTSVGREVPVWFKFVFLSELLEASMADILFLFDHGHLVDFSPQEIVKLIRALFADSPLRNRNIEKVLQGHPAVTPNDEEDEDWGAFA